MVRLMSRATPGWWHTVSMQYIAAVNILIAIISQLLSNWGRRKITWPAFASRNFHCFLGHLSIHH